MKPLQVISAKFAVILLAITSLLNRIAALKFKPRKITMKICAVCGKKPIVGRSISRRGMAKKAGGVGKKITGISRRRFLPNLQKVRARLSNGSVKRILVCTSCIQAGKVVKAA